MSSQSICKQQERSSVEVTGATRPYRAVSLLTAGLCCVRKWNLPAWKYEYGRMAVEGTGKNFRSLDT